MLSCLPFTELVDHVRNCATIQWAWEKINTIDTSDIMNYLRSSGDGIMSRVEPYINKMKIMWSKLEERPEMKYIKAYAIRTFEKVCSGSSQLHHMVAHLLSVHIFQ